MSVSYGVTAAGFVIKPFAEILAEINALFQSVFGNTIDLSPSEPFGQWAAIQASREWELWQLAQAVYSARDPNAAEGVGLVEIASITGTVPVTPTQSEVTVTLCGTSAAVIPINSVISVPRSGTQFKTSIAVTLEALTPWAQDTAYSTPGQQVTANGQVYQLYSAGTSALTGTGPSGTMPGPGYDFLYGDGSCFWAWVGTGTYTAYVICYSVLYGPQLAAAGTLTTISTPVAGWSTALNFLDALPGLGTETDTQLRVRRVEELSLHGNARVDAIQAQLVALANAQGQPLLTAASVFENDTDVTDAFSLPPHSVQAVVLYPGAPVTATDLAVATTILAAKAAGIQTSWGTATGGAQRGISVNDAQGVAHTIDFAYPTPVNIYVTAVITQGENYAGDSAVQEVITSFAAGLIPGFTGYGMGVQGTVYAGALVAAIMGANIGVSDCEITLSLTSSGYSTAPIVPTRTQIPAFDSSRIIVEGP